MTAGADWVTAGADLVTADWVTADWVTAGADWVTTDWVTADYHQQRTSHYPKAKNWSGIQHKTTSKPLDIT